jgi:dihydroxy-acid dehydratase
MHFKLIAEAVKRGVWKQVAFHSGFPVISLGEVFYAAHYHDVSKLMAMDVEESICIPNGWRGFDGGCDKTTPAQIMGAASAGLPTIMIPGGPMLRGYYKNEVIGSGTDVWRFETCVVRVK